MSSVGKQLLVAGGCLAGAIGLLALLGRKGPNEGNLSSPFHERELSSAVLEEPRSEVSDEALRLLPPSSWLLLRLHGSLFEESPFTGDPECEKIPAPTYFYFSASESETKKEDVEFTIASDVVAPEFARCVVHMIDRHGGKALEKGSFETKSGVLVLRPNRLVFSTNTSAKDALVARLDGRAIPSPLPSRHGLSAKENGNLLSASLVLDKAWLDAASASLEIRPEESPLIGLEGATFEVGRDRVGRGEFRCVPAKCERLARFVHGAVSDLVSTLPPALRGRLEGSLGVRYPIPGAPGRIEVALEPTGLTLLLAMVRYWSGGEEKKKP